MDNTSESNPYASPPPKDPHTAMPVEPLSSGPLGKIGQVRILAVLMMIQGGLEVAMGLFLAAMSVFVPTMMQQQAATNPQWQDGTTGQPPEEMFWFMMAMYGGMGLAALVPGVLHLLAGWRAYRFRSRTFAIVALCGGLVTVASCYCVPTALGLMIYGLIVLLDEPVHKAFVAVANGQTVDSVMARFYRSKLPPTA